MKRKKKNLEMICDPCASAMKLEWADISTEVMFENCDSCREHRAVFPIERYK